MEQALGNGVVVIQFRLTESNKLASPMVFSANKQLNDELTKQLMSAKLSLPEGVASDQLHTARLRFRVAE